MSRAVFYGAVEPLLTLYDLDVEAAALMRRGSVSLPGNVQYAYGVGLRNPGDGFSLPRKSSGSAGDLEARLKAAKPLIRLRRFDAQRRNASIGHLLPACAGRREASPDTLDHMPYA
ncbi:hypothetical protein [Vineibacter terrae]|uniref:hypothetical protein n=1 Tax=Vineibacter terrae TaxID=2586908 RepID=UPI002E3125E3|nr:hypothetical protein [Vineibacter terrae]HEX2892317.1 hypothetical protein [Vineibacter terrae]